MSEPTDWSAWNEQILEANKKIVAEFRANGGHVEGYFAGAPMLLLHHLGARSGAEHVNPLVYVRDDDDWVVAASKGGAPDNPAWYHNLKAHPRTTIEIDTRTLAVEASEVVGEERDRLYRRLAAIRPAFAGYEARTSRTIPMFRLTVVERPERE